LSVVSRPSAPTVAQHPAVVGRVGHLGGEHGDHVAGGVVLLDQCMQSRRAEQRNIAVGDHHSAGQWFGIRCGEGLEAALDGAAGPLGLVLVGDHGVRSQLGDVRGDLVAFVPDDDHQVIGGEVAGCGHRVAEQRGAADAVEHLGDCRFHAGPLARCEYDDGGRAMLAHADCLLGNRDQCRPADRNVPEVPC
jgi:hypothetical protein